MIILFFPADERSSQHNWELPGKDISYHAPRKIMRVKQYDKPLLLFKSRRMNE